MEFELDREGKFGKEGLTFDDVLLLPAESAVLPNDVATATRLTPTIALEIPIVSAAMDTVTEARLAIALARQGGLGIIHRNLAIEHQVAEIDKVKRSEAGMIVSRRYLTKPSQHRLRHSKKLFGVFQRLHKMGEYPGTGVGLAIVKKSIERMGGRVGMDAEEGVGSRFWMELRSINSHGISISAAGEAA